MFCALLSALWFGFLELRGLYFPDEGRYAEIPREMLDSGDWITPRLNGITYFEKPPLQYWATAAVFAVAGEDEWTARLAPAIAGLLAVLAVFLTARKLYGRRAGWMAAAVLGSSCGYFMSNQFVTLDMTLTALLTGALCAFLRAQRTDAPNANRGWMYLAWGLCGLAFLAKGAIALVLPTLAVLAYVATTRDLRLLARLHIAVGLSLSALIVVPWLIAAEMRNPGFLQFFLINEHWNRFLHPTHQRGGPWWYFIPILVGFLLPWVPAILLNVRRSVRPLPASTGFKPGHFAWCWAFSILIFFSLSSSKLPPYILPALAGIALAVAPALARRWAATLSVTATTMIVGALAGAILAVPATQYIKVEVLRASYAENVGWLIAGMLVLVAAGATTLFLNRRHQRIPALACLVLGGMLGCQVAAVTAYRIDAYFSAEQLVENLSGGEAIRPFKPEVPFYSVDFFDHSVPFYLGRTVTLVRERGEIAWGIERTGANYIATLDEFMRRWRDDAEAYAIMTVETYGKLVNDGLPMRVVEQDVRRIVVSRN